MCEVREKVAHRRPSVQFFYRVAAGGITWPKGVFIYLLYYVRENRPNRLCVAFVCCEGVIYCLCIYLRL